MNTIHNGRYVLEFGEDAVGPLLVITRPKGGGKYLQGEQATKWAEHIRTASDKSEVNALCKAIIEKISRDSDTGVQETHNMIKSELQELLDRAGWKRSELARRLEVHPNTVSNWGQDAPGYALAYLRLYVAVKESLE